MGVLQGLFSPDIKSRPLVVEVEKPLVLSKIDPEVRKSVLSLANHPGFLFLLEKLKIQKSYLQSRLVNDEHKRTRDFERIQLGVQWASWLETQLKAETQLADRDKKPEVAAQNEIDAFNLVDAQLELVGQ